ncbi:MAG TPA: GspH/FimT family pseudopilin [Gemmatimonadales bacterium]|nr:GspH/FimT family pseudopilin [Gemmatimonadales bacterium]
MTQTHLTRAANRGITLAELLLVIVIIGILTSISVPAFGRTVQRSRVNQAAGVVATDLEQTVSLAARRRRPVVLSVESAGIYTVRDRATSPNDTLRLRRNLSSTTGDFPGLTLTFSGTPVQVFPNGAVSTPLTVTISGGGHTRTVTLSAAGQVRQP